VERQDRFAEQPGGDHRARIKGRVLQLAVDSGQRPVRVRRPRQSPARAGQAREAPASAIRTSAWATIRADRRWPNPSRRDCRPRSPSEYVLRENRISISGSAAPRPDVENRPSFMCGSSHLAIWRICSVPGVSPVVWI
jgi:hypothetical protein